MKLSKRMKQTLTLLAELRLSTSMDRCRKSLERFTERAAPIMVKLGKMPQLEVTEEQVKREYFTRISRPIKRIIIDLEENLRSMEAEMYDGIFIKTDKLAPNVSIYTLRTKVSLPELLMGTLLPKGRDGWYHGGCKRVQGYKEAKQQAEKLYASYTRTLNRLSRLKLVATAYATWSRAKRYYITDKGLSILNDFGILNVSEIEKLPEVEQ